MYINSGTAPQIETIFEKVILYHYLQSSSHIHLPPPLPPSSSVYTPPVLKMLTSILTLTLAAVASALPLAPRVTCYSGVYVIGARGTDEDPGFGSTASVVTSVLAAIPGSGSVALDYPASVLDPLYPSSVSKGINAMISLINTYTSSCPGNVVVVGFSQGGNVITDMLAGGVAKPDPLPASVVKRSESPSC